MMRGLWMMLFPLMLCGISELRAEQPEGARIEFSTKVIELGELSQSADKPIIRLTYKNIGDVPLVVLEVRTSCSCTDVQFKRDKVLPGERGVINITMDPSKAPVGSFFRVLQVVSTSTTGVERITLKAEIIE